ncbi:aromatic acid exporter family protein [Evansella sp. AB-P1]|uniref:aromatic acid exporter family protein n=1 Tax=Evansella sp. AB-P1 TaxID=3037653 RepID=UPI00241EB37B|nr:aromatic acid exporter family protein [Evansella sp. AB-P1]MDG5786266.1 aromatic acid exporter family protein [Evansella sp. AB-P1]
MRLGARIFKTGLAVMLALYSSMWLGFATPAFSGLAAFFAVQPSVHKSFMTIKDQIQGNVLSAILAIIFVLAFGHEPFVIAVVVMLVIAIHIKLKKEAIIPLAVVTSIIIMGSPTDEFIHFATNRFFLIMIGVLSAFIINLIFLPPKHENLLYHKIADTNEQIIQWIRLIARHEAEYRTLKKDLEKLKESLVKIENLFLLYKEERNYLRKNEYSRLRKVVLFRQMVQGSKKAISILKSLSKYENVIHHFPEEMQDVIQTQLEYLTNYHERILLKYMGKVRASHSTTDLFDDIETRKQHLTDLFLTLHNDPEIDQSEWIHLFPVVALIIEYSEELEHLDQLVDGFFKYHTSENEVKIREKEL